jgi:hypothetical protein
MRKSIAIAITLFFIAYGSYAQIGGGVRLGANISNVKVDSPFGDISYDSKIGALAGVYLTAQLADKIALQPELLYSGYGAKLDEVNLNLGYVSVPVFLQYQINEMFNLNVGPQFGFLLSAKSEDEDIKDSFKGLDLGGALGLGLNFGKFNAGLRYYLGLSNISDQGGDFKVKNNAFQLVVGYQLFGK